MKEVAWVPGFAAANDFLDSTGYAGQIDAELVALLREGAALPLLTTSRADVFRARMWDALVVRAARSPDLPHALRRTFRGRPLRTCVPRR
jgi:hypothetical protein